jgi:hypothetical protein
MVKCGVLFEVRTEILNVICMRFDFTGPNKQKKCCQFDLSTVIKDTVLSYNPTRM